MMADGWAKFYRKIREHAVWDHDGIFKLFFHCVMEANWKTSSYKIPGRNELVEIERGQFVTGQNVLYSGLYRRPSKDAPNARTVWKWLHTLQDFECVKLHALGTKCTVVSVINYESYQDKDDAQGEAGAKQGHSEGEAGATSEEGKKGKKGTKKEKTGADAFVPIPDSLNTTEFIEVWSQWKKHRREIKAPLTATQAEKQLENFAKWGIERSISAMDHTITQGWQGIREPESGKYGKPESQKPVSQMPTPEEDAAWTP
jgi:hypothetical protein